MKTQFQNKTLTDKFDLITLTKKIKCHRVPKINSAVIKSRKMWKNTQYCFNNKKRKYKEPKVKMEILQ